MADQLTLGRRGLLAGAGGAVGLYSLGQRRARPVAAAPQRLPRDDPFTLGVASGDPSPDGVVLWTRLAPEPLAEDGHGGMPPQPVAVRYEVATDEHFRAIVRRGTAPARAEFAHAVHVELDGLLPHRWYWYRFRLGAHVSPTGRTRTLPEPGAQPAALPFAFVSCQDWQTGYYTAYRHLAAEDLDLVVHLGDYIYEYASYGPDYPRPQPGTEPGDDSIRTLAEYRNRYALYRTDADLQAAHRAFAWVTTLDDHEVQDSWADETNLQVPPSAFRDQRAAALRAYYEHMPLRRRALPQGPDMRLYRRVAYGDLATFNVLDTRQFRAAPACGGGRLSDCDERWDPARSLPGAEQERWLHAGLADAETRWNVLAQSVFFSQWAMDGDPELFSMDAWDGYASSRERVLRTVTEAPVPNFIVLTGDIHLNIAADIKADFTDPDSATLGSEFAGTSVSSAGDGTDLPWWAPTDLQTNPHFAFINGQRGYVRCHVTRGRWRSDYRVVPYVSTPGAPVSTRRSFVVEAGHPGLQEV